MPPHHPPPPPAGAAELGVEGMLTPQRLRQLVKDGSIDTVLVAIPDMYGRLVGKRFDAEYFLADVIDGGTHGCDYLLAADMDMTPIEGFKYANWERGYGDFHMVPDLTTLRVMSWKDSSAMVLCDVMAPHGGGGGKGEGEGEAADPFLPFAPRSVLRRQIASSQSIGYSIVAASELEFYLNETSYRDAYKAGYHQEGMRSVSDYVQDYHTLQTAREEKYTQEFRRHLKRSGIPVECSKGEAGVGQHELNVRYTDILHMSDRHSVYKQCLKEMADDMGISVTFMAKPYTDATGSGCHIHLSLHNADGSNAFAGADELGPVRCSEVFRHFLGGWIKYTPDVMVFYAPTINSYKRFQSSSWAPTRLAWSYDNRTAGYRVVGGGKNLRIECRIPGADVNAYLAFAGSLASGLAGVRNAVEPPPLFEGNIYEAREIPEVPKSLAVATELFHKSDMAREAFGDHVVDHYAHFFRSEVSAYDAAVTDWERQRYYEQI